MGSGARWFGSFGLEGKQRGHHLFRVLSSLSLSLSLQMHACAYIETIAERWAFCGRGASLLPFQFLLCQAIACLRRIAKLQNAAKVKAGWAGYE